MHDITIPFPFTVTRDKSEVTEDLFKLEITEKDQSVDELEEPVIGMYSYVN